MFGWPVPVRGSALADLRAGLFLIFALVLLWPAAPAFADCATAGSTVTCSSTGGTQTTPVGTSIEDNLTVNVQSGATIDVSGSPGAAAIDLNDSNTVTNAGRLIGGDFNAGISVNNGNMIINSGSIAVGDNAAAISGCCDNTIINSGSIAAGSNSSGVLVNDRDNVTNSGTITVGTLGYGIIAVGDGASTAVITNSGTINAIGGFGIGASANYNVINSGTINAGNNGVGIQVGGSNTVTNSGTINVSSAGFGNGIGIYLNAFGAAGNTVTNSGSILATGQTFAIFGDSDNIIVNTGMLQGAVVLPGFNNTLTNRGYMIGADLAFPIPSGGFIGGTLINDPAGTIAIRVTPTQNDFFSADAVVLNGGRLHMVVRPGLYGATTVYSPGTSGAAPISSCSCTPITGTFNSITTSSAFFTAAADYSTVGEVDVTLTRHGFGAASGATPNQRAVGNALEPGYSPGLDPASIAGQFYANLLAANSLSVLDQLSGAGTAAAQDAAFTAGGLFSGAILQQGLAWLNGTGGGFGTTFGGLPYAAQAQKKITGRPGADAFAAMEPSKGALARMGLRIRRHPVDRWRIWHRRSARHHRRWRVRRRSRNLVRFAGRFRGRREQFAFLGFGTLDQRQDRRRSCRHLCAENFRHDLSRRDDELRTRRQQHRPHDHRRGRDRICQRQL